MTSVIGEIAALLTAILWAFNSVVFTLAGRRVGAVTVNLVRLWVAIPALLLLHRFLHGTIFPYDIEPHRFFYLGFSGLIGFVVGDGMLFESFLLIGPRRAMLLSLLAPVFGAVMAWVWLKERLLPLEIVSILVIIGGIAWVVGERRAGDD
jgi:drug/metabolite transporter (DMT)-like permease